MKHLLGEHLLQPEILLLELAQPPGLGRLHAGVPLAVLVEGLSTTIDLPAHGAHWDPVVDLAQRAEHHLERERLSSWHAVLPSGDLPTRERAARLLGGGEEQAHRLELLVDAMDY